MKIFCSLSIYMVPARYHLQTGAPVQGYRERAHFGMKLPLCRNCRYVETPETGQMLGTSLVINHSEFYY